MSPVSSGCSSVWEGPLRERGAGVLGSWGAACGRHSEQERRGSSGLPVLEPVRKGRQLTRGRGPGRRLLGTLVLTGAPCGVGGSGGRGRGCPRLQRALRSMLRLPLRRGRGLQGRPWAKRPRPRARGGIRAGVPRARLRKQARKKRGLKPACLRVESASWERLHVNPVLFFGFWFCSLDQYRISLCAAHKRTLSWPSPTVPFRSRLVWFVTGGGHTDSPTPRRGPGRASRSGTRTLTAIVPTSQ